MPRTIPTGIPTLTPRFDDPESMVEPSVDSMLVAVACAPSLVVLVTLFVGCDDVGEAVEDEDEACIVAHMCQ